ncbi:putative T7SS-secreted protein [Gordonia sp. SCSIO 19800]|uniref:putative T7SS-secreted protein n=1 Tax=Gordonia sp. SCSIO 19800 TaxID=2826926 RepID=UPI002011BBE2|nr:hypothetical protein [Gordonia sp. SCSIO 19800]
MGLFDALEGGKEVVGGLVDGATEILGGGLRAVGLDSIATNVEDFGDGVANSLGAMPDEKNLGETKDPRELILGDPAGITSLAEKFTGFAGNFVTAGEGLRAISVDHWSGDGAQEFADAIGHQVPPWFAASDAAAKAAAALTGWAGVVTFAQQKAAEAVRIWEEGERNGTNGSPRPTSTTTNSTTTRTIDATPRPPIPDPIPGPDTRPRRSESSKSAATTATRRPRASRPN